QINISIEAMVLRLETGCRRKLYIRSLSVLTNVQCVIPASHDISVYNSKPSKRSLCNKNFIGIFYARYESLKN
ncbi:hypothetical protein L9F63_014311, partial [Diploptera punctata]